MTLQSSRADIDQPFVRTAAVASADRVYVGLNDFDAPDGRTATVDVSLDGGATYRSRRIETRTTLGQNGPSIRPAVARDHTVYVAYFGWRSQTGSDVTSDVVVVRDDSGATGSAPFKHLVDPSDHLPGRLVASSVTIPWSNAPTLGQERIGSHPATSFWVYSPRATRPIRLTSRKVWCINDGWISRRIGCSMARARRWPFRSIRSFSVSPFCHDDKRSS